MEFIWFYSGFTPGFTFYFNDIFSQLSLIYLFVEFCRFWSFLLNWEQIWFVEEMEECFPLFANSFYILMKTYTAFI